VARMLWGIVSRGAGCGILIGHILMFFTSGTLRLLMVELTNLCNLRCKMCGIWEEKPKRTMGLGEFEEIFDQETTRGVKVVALTGGEPFLIPEFFDYYATARRRRGKAHINVSSNGFYTEKTLEFFRRAGDRNLSITISYDGARSHDAIRGVAGSAAKLLETARAVKREFPANGVSLKMTVMAENHGEVAETARQCKEMGIPFRMKTLEKLNECHQSRFPSEVTGPNYDPTMVKTIAGQVREVAGMGVETNREYLQDLLRVYEGESVACSCSPRTMFVGFDGKVFLCRKKSPIGNALEEGLDAIWNGEMKKHVVEQMAACRATGDTLGFRHA
jgi:MoaA/NifB/PqqE/SkfB family radical SAM enzyme